MNELDKELVKKRTEEQRKLEDIAYYVIWYFIIVLEFVK